MRTHHQHRLIIGATVAVLAGVVALAIEAGPATRGDAGGRRSEAQAVTPQAPSRPAPATAPGRLPSPDSCASTSTAAATADEAACTSPAPAPAADTAAAVAEATPAQRVRARRDQLVSDLRRSAGDAGPWRGAAEAVIQSFQAGGVPELAGRVRFGALECHAAGCFVEASYADGLVFELADERLVASDAFHGYPGWRHRAGPILADDGTVTATWFFMAPEPPARL